MSNKKNLVERVNTYSFSETEIHKALGIKGNYLECGLYKGRSPEDVEQRKSPDDDTYYIKTEKNGTVLFKQFIRVENTNVKNYIFLSGGLRDTLGLDGFIETFNRDGDKYIITTTNTK